MLEALDKIQPNRQPRSGGPALRADQRRRPQAEEGPLSILYEDEALLVLDKPAGTVIHPTYKNTSGTLLNAVLWRLRDRADARPGILTRLDKDTSGVVVIGLLADVHATMQRDAFAGRVRKEYLAIVHGTPQPQVGTIVLPLARDPADRRRVIAVDGGAASETRYEVIASRGGMSAVRCELVTGRTHQIRVHLAASGWPIVGDAVYGRGAAGGSAPDAASSSAADAPDIARQALHAWRIALPHPLTRAALTFEAPLPPDVTLLFDALTA